MSDDVCELHLAPKTLMVGGHSTACWRGFWIGPDLFGIIFLLVGGHVVLFVAYLSDSWRPSSPTSYLRVPDSIVFWMLWGIVVTLEHLRLGSFWSLAPCRS